jgi:sterol desaturase/sphingolipid hydroxylase (fatty acid hydroxylase superfamily)
MGLHPASVACFFSLFIGYVLSASTLQWWFYHRQGHTPRSWKAQPGALAHAPDGRGRVWVWCFPLLDLLRSPPFAATGIQQPRHALHPVFATVNLLVSSTFAGASCELFHRGGGSLNNTCGLGRACATQLLTGVLSSLAVQSILEYYWHALMHTPWFYSRLHRYHHFYKAPQVFDDLFIHPIEAFGYFCILFSPAVLVRQHWAAFLAYMAICGVFGILDHSGIAVTLLGRAVYDTRAHDVHHQKGFGPGVFVNLAFPFTFMDILHRTFVAPQDAGYTYTQ